jgi:hypothetical protein
MSLKDDGFFSPDLKQFVAKNRSENREWFALADDLRKLSQRLMLAIEPPADPNSVCMHLMFARAVTSFQAALLLIERGMPADAGTLMRSFLETTMFFGAARYDSEFNIKLLAADRDHKVKVANPLVAFGPDNYGLTSQQIEELKKWLADPEAPEAKKITLAPLMKKMGLDAIYDTYFRGLSGDFAHTTVQSLNLHVATNGHGEMIGTKWGPDASRTANTLMDLCSVTFYLFNWVHDVHGDLGVEGDVTTAWKQYCSLLDQRYPQHQPPSTPDSQSA